MLRVERKVGVGVCVCVGVCRGGMMRGCWGPQSSMSLIGHHLNIK